MIKKLFGFLIAFAFPLICNSQQKTKPDAVLSYNEIIAEKEDTVKVKDLNNLGKVYYEAGKNDSAIYLGETSLALARKLNYSLGEANANSLLGVALFELGKYPEAAHYYFSALKIFEQLGTPKVVASMYNNIGNVYRKSKDFPKALKYQHEALKRHRKEENKRGVAKTFVGLAQIYKEQGQASKALVCYDTAIDILKSIGEGRGLSICYNNVGNIYFELKNYPEALKYQFKGLELKENADNQDALSYSYYNIGKIYNAMRQPQKSREWFEKSMVLAKKGNITEIIAADYNGLATMDSLNGNFKSAYKNYIHYSQYKDRLLNTETIRKITEAGLKYQYEKQEAIRELQFRKNIAETRLRWGIGLLSFLILAISGFSLLFISKVKRKKERILLHSQNRIMLLEKEKADNELKLARENLEQFIKKVNDKNVLIESITGELEEMKNEQGHRASRLSESLTGLREMQILTNEDWLSFLSNFNILYPRFIINLKQQHPKITTSELRYLMLSKIGLEHKQMANTLGVSNDTIRVTWNRVRHKLGGTPEDTPQSLMEAIENQKTLLAGAEVG